MVSQCNEAEKRIEIQSERLTKVQNIMRFAVLFAQRAVALEEAFPLMKSRIAVLSQLKNLTKIPLESLTVEQVDIKLVILVYLNVFNIDNSQMRSVGFHIKSDV